MPTFGLTLTGLVPMTLPDIIEDLQARVWDRLGTTLDLSDRSLEGQLIRIIAERLALLWELLEQVSISIDPDKATAALLDALCLLTGTFRDGPTASVVILTLTGDPATLVPSGSGSRVPTLTQFNTNADATLVALAAWTITTAYSIGDRRTNVTNAYVVTTAGTSAGAGGPSTTDEVIPDGTVVWRFMGVGTAAVDAEAVATETGPLIANSGTVTEIVTPVGGWDGVINLLDAVVGNDQMTDAELRVAREIELARPGTSTQNAIRAALLDVDGVTAVTVFMNVTDAVDVDGLPPHSVEALVQGGDDQDIWDALLANVAAGIQTFGTEVGIAVDDSNVDQTMRFTRPTEIAINVRIDLIKDPAIYPADGDDQVRAAVVAFGNGQKTGKNAVASSIGAQAFEVVGLLDVTLTFIAINPAVPVVSTTIQIALRELATYDTSNIIVNAINGVP
jgi:uncharacterized phage protein gp47/JayE